MRPMVNPMRAFERGRQGGFSYLWLLLLIALLGVGLTRVVEIEATLTQRDKEIELLFIGEQFSQALNSYWRTAARPETRVYPAALDDLLLDRRDGQVRRHLRKVFVDPVSGRAEWGFLRVGGRIVGVHSLSTQRPVKQGNFAYEHEALQGKEEYAQWVFGPALAIESEASNPLTSPGAASSAKP